MVKGEGTQRGIAEQRMRRSCLGKNHQSTGGVCVHKSLQILQHAHHSVCKGEGFGLIVLHSCFKSEIEMCCIRKQFRYPDKTTYVFATPHTHTSSPQSKASDQ